MPFLILPMYNDSYEGRDKCGFRGRLMERMLLLMELRPQTGSVGWLVWLLAPVPTSGHAVLLVLWPFSSRPLGPILPVN